MVASARAGRLDSWAGDAENCLALIVVVDQFPRHLFRGQARAFESDQQAIGLASSLLQSGQLETLGLAERAFALMPYQHSESLECQQEGLEAYQQQVDNAPEAWREIMQNYADFAKQHRQIIQQFGRFPHRNAVLGRENTPEEAAYLALEGSRFGQ